VAVTPGKNPFESGICDFESTDCDVRFVHLDPAIVRRILEPCRELDVRILTFRCPDNEPVAGTAAGIDVPPTGHLVRATSSDDFIARASCSDRIS
jgi:hypothetical protein